MLKCSSVAYILCEVEWSLSHVGVSLHGFIIIIVINSENFMYMFVSVQAIPRYYMRAHINRVENIRSRIVQANLMMFLCHLPV